MARVLKSLCICCAWCGVDVRDFPIEVDFYCPGKCELTIIRGAIGSGGITGQCSFTEEAYQITKQVMAARGVVWTNPRPKWYMKRFSLKTEDGMSKKFSLTIHDLSDAEAGKLIKMFGGGAPATAAAAAPDDDDDEPPKKEEKKKEKKTAPPPADDDDDDDVPPKKEEKKAEPGSKKAKIVAELQKASKLREVLTKLVELGHSDLDDIIRICTKVQADVPVLAKVQNLEDRIRRSAEVLGLVPAKAEDDDE